MAAQLGYDRHGFESGLEMSGKPVKQASYLTSLEDIGAFDEAYDIVVAGF